MIIIIAQHICQRIQHTQKAVTGRAHPAMYCHWLPNRPNLATGKLINDLAAENFLWQLEYFSKHHKFSAALSCQDIFLVWAMPKNNLQRCCILLATNKFLAFPEPVSLFGQSMLFTNRRQLFVSGNKVKFASEM